MAVKKKQHEGETVQEYDEDYEDQERARKLERRRLRRQEALAKFSDRKQRIYKVSMLALNVHGAAFLGVSSLLFALNFLVAVLSRNGTPWSLFAIVGWGGFVLVHYLITYSLFMFYDLPSEELDEYWQVFLEEWKRRGLPIVRRVVAGDLFPGGSPVTKAWKLIQQIGGNK